MFCVSTSSLHHARVVTYALLPPDIKTWWYMQHKHRFEHLNQDLHRDKFHFCSSRKIRSSVYVLLKWSSDLEFVLLGSVILVLCVGTLRQNVVAVDICTGSVAERHCFFSVNLEIMG